MGVASQEAYKGKRNTVFFRIVAVISSMFEDSYYLGCGFYSNKHSNCRIFPFHNNIRIGKHSIHKQICIQTTIDALNKLCRLVQADALDVHEPELASF